MSTSSWVLAAVLVTVACAAPQRDSLQSDWERAKMAVSKWAKPEIEMAPYTVLRRGQDYEVRSYPARKWVCSTTSIQGRQPTEEERSENFMKLFGYISGKNRDGIKIKMTSPVTMMARPAMFQMCFYVPALHQTDAPAASDDGITMQMRPETTVIVARDGGYPTEDEWELMAMRLKRAAMMDGETDFDFSQYYSAGYDSPMKFWDRRNEVWYLKKGSKAMNGCPLAA